MPFKMPHKILAVTFHRRVSMAKGYFNVKVCFTATATACYFLLLSISVGEDLTLFSYFIFQHEGKRKSVVPRKATTTTEEYS